MAALFLAVDFTDGRTTTAIAFDPEGDTEASVARITSKMAEDGMRPVKGSARIVERPGAFKVREPQRHFLDVRGAGLFRTKRHSIPSAR